LGLMLKVPFGVTIDQAKTAVEATTKDKMFVANLVLQRGVFKVLGTSEQTLRIYGFGLYLMLMLGTAKLLQKHHLDENSGLAMLILAVNPWLTNLSLFFLPEFLAITVLIWCQATDNRWLKIILSLIAILSSPIGMAGGAILGVRSMVKHKWREVMVFGLIIFAVLITNQAYVKQSMKEAWVKNLNPAVVSQNIDEDQKINFLATGQTYQLPTILRRVVNNKLTYILKMILEKTLSVMDPTAWTQPNDAWVVTGLSGFPTKGNFQLFYYWEIPLLVWGLIKQKKNLFIWLTLLAIPAILVEQKYILTSGLLMMPVLSWLLISGWKQLPVKLILPLAIALYSIAGIYFYRQVFFEQEDRLNSYPQVFRIMANLTEKYEREGKNMVVTERLGPTKLMFKFYGLTQANITIREFNLATEKPAENTLYIGLPGEFAPGLVIQEKINYGDELVYKYGKGIWAGR